MKLQPYRQLSVSQRKNFKLSPLFYGPYRVEDKVGTTAYKLKLPAEVEIHPVFHVSQLKKSIPASVTAITTLPALPHTPPVPIAILDRKLVKRGNSAVTKILVQWSDKLPEEATWEFFFDIQQRFPHINLVDKVS